MGIEYRVRGHIAPEDVRGLVASSWEEPHAGDWAAVLARSLTWVTAHEGRKLVGFVHVAWDGGAHAFLLDPTVHPSIRRRGIGSALVRMAVESTRCSGVEWLHVDYEAHLTSFYEGGGFRPSAAGLIRFQNPRADS
jgi:ribosomal protein S18 acetylase RimI-like enzyme